MGSQRSRLMYCLYWVLGLLWIGAHALGMLGPVAQLTFILLTGATLLATVCGVRRNRPAVRWPWLLIAAALATFLIGGALREQFQTTGDLSPARSLLPDAFTIPGYLVFGVGLLGLVRARGRGGESDLDAMLDAAIGGCSALTFAWLYLVNPALHIDDAPFAVRLSLAVYPTISVGFVVVTARLGMSAGHRSVAHRTVLAAMAFMLAGDILYTLVETHVLAHPGLALDVPYALAYLCFGFTVLHPSMRELSRPQAGEDHRSRGRLALIAIALIVPAVVSLANRSYQGLDQAVLVTTVMTLTALVVARVLLAVHRLTDAQRLAAYQATHDSLTGLPNRRALEQRLEAALAPEAEPRTIALLFLDLDRFKVVNDSSGHSVGDGLLLSVTQRLRAILPNQEQIYRLGGDEFVVLLFDYQDANEPLILAETIRDAFHAAFVVGTEVIYSSTSIGIACTPTDSYESLLRDADTALYQAKDAGRDSVVVFDEAMRDAAEDRMTLERDLHDALARKELHLHYQPIVDLRSGEIGGFEALLRWRHPTRGNVPPLDFIAIAEDSGQICTIGSWTLDEASRQLAKWRAQATFGRDLYVTVNVSMRQVREQNFVQVVTGILARYGLPAGAIRLELTESLVMEDGHDAVATLEKIRAAGIPIYVDDFGTGYSSLAYLSRLPVSCVKIDKSFIDPLVRRVASAESLVTAITAMAAALHLTTVAEGVETSEQADRLIELGCTAAQGYLYSRPLPPEEILTLLQDRAHLRPKPRSSSEVGCDDDTNPNEPAVQITN